MRSSFPLDSVDVRLCLFGEELGECLVVDESKPHKDHAQTPAFAFLGLERFLELLLRNLPRRQEHLANEEARLVHVVAFDRRARRRQL